MSFERSFFFGCVQKDLEDSSGKEQLAAFPSTMRWAKQKQRTVRRRERLGGLLRYYGIHGRSRCSKAITIFKEGAE